MRRCDEEQNKGQCENDRECPSMSSEENKIVPVSEENQKKPNIEVIESKDELRPICRIKPKMPNEFKSETENKRISLNKNDKKALSICLPKPSRTFQLGRTVLNRFQQTMRRIGASN